MNEKKLTDEEIVKALAHCFHNRSCEYCYHNDEVGSGEIVCRSRLMGKILDLIHRLQSENEKQREEIERLTEKVFDCTAVMEYNEKCSKEIQAATILLERRNNEIAELQKQVDELKESANGHLLTSLYKKQADDHKRAISKQRTYWEKKVQQAAKDTAKEIYGEIDKSDILVVETQDYGEIEVVPIERLKEIIKSKGVEVE